MKSKRLQLGLLAILMALCLVVFFGHQAIADWLRLRNYTPSTAVAGIATQDGMTARAKHLFYVNHPVISGGADFTSHCPSGEEKTVVLGCYVGNDQGIYVYDVSDTRLDGVEQVTAAHEMLHAAYRRLSSQDRKQVDKLLTDFYNDSLTDQRIKDTIAAYQKSEPNDVVNEMHSIFGTEVAQLPPALETYYKQYFSDRATVTAFTAKYQGEFTSRQSQVAAYDTELSDLKTRIESSKTVLETRRGALEAQETRMNGERAAGQTAAYNSEVASYNQKVDEYNTLANATKALINKYNDIVNARNAIALEEQQLAKELSASSVR
jgi:hypothetical protein